MEKRCPNCNAILILQDNKLKCEYCRSIFENKNNNMDFIIPFELNKLEAIKEYKKLIKSRLLTPYKFKNKKLISKLESIYVPCYLYDYESNGMVEFEGEKINIWKSSGKKYKKTDVHKITRSGSISLERVIISSSNSFDNNNFDRIIPYDYSKLTTNDNSNLEKYKVYDRNNTKEELLFDANNKAKQLFCEVIKQDIKDYSNLKLVSDSINLYNTRIESVLMPLFRLNIKYKNKDYTYLINGQNGKVYGSIPINKKRIICMWIILFIILFSILFFINWVIL